MDQNGKLKMKKSLQKLRRFRYPALVLLLGLALILWPTRPKPAATAEPVVPEQAPVSVEAQLEEILSCVDGAGTVRVLLTKRTGDETRYQSDETLSKNENGEERSGTTVVVRSSGGADVPVVRQIVYGQYQGALIVCTGADSPAVRLELVNAVAGLTGLSTDRITVIKMKQ